MGPQTSTSEHRTHINQVRKVSPRTPLGCEECLKSGDT